MARANILFNVASVQVLPVPMLPVPNWKLDLVLAILPHLDRRSLLSSEACCAKEDGEGGWQHLEMFRTRFSFWSSINLLRGQSFPIKTVKLANYQTDSTCKLLSSLESRQVLQLDSLTVYQLYNNQPFEHSNIRNFLRDSPSCFTHWVKRKTKAKPTILLRQTEILCFQLPLGFNEVSDNYI